MSLCHEATNLFSFFLDPHVDHHPDSFSGLAIGCLPSLPSLAVKCPVMPHCKPQGTTQVLAVHPWAMKHHRLAQFLMCTGPLRLSHVLHCLFHAEDQTQGFHARQHAPQQT